MNRTKTIQEKEEEFRHERAKLFDMVIVQIIVLSVLSGLFIGIESTSFVTKIIVKSLIFGLIGLDIFLIIKSFWDYSNKRGIFIEMKGGENTNG